ncbi:MAG: DUF262 domain-containing protein [Pseudomonadota bacterium]
MPSSFEKAITILQAIRNIDNRTFLLPALQRNFVWTPQQICILFDSLMREYPINTFMLWDVNDQSIKDKYRFYSFLSHYCQRFNEANDYVPTHGDFHDFKAVIDGQQRLTSIYIGLKGTYAYKQPRVWWPATQNDTVLPPRRLYLNLARGMQGDEDEDKFAMYNFRFLTDKQFQNLNLKAHGEWFEVGKVLSLPEVKTVDQITFKVVLPYLKAIQLHENEFACAALTRLYHLIRYEPVINFYNETSQDIDHVLDVFIRTNSGGTPLAFSDLLMSIAIANWEGDARRDIDSLVTDVRQGSDMKFSIGRDWVLKACLMLTDADVRFRVKNFDVARVGIIQKQWPAIKECLTTTFKLLRLMGFNDESIRAKNAIIPIAYYLYRQVHENKPLYASITNLKWLRDERAAIARWLNMVLLKSSFSGQADAVLTRMYRLLKRHLDIRRFPLDKIIEAFVGTNRDLRFDEAYLRGLLDIEHGDPRCRPVLNLLYPDVNENLQFDIDHLHPSSAFTKKALNACPFLAGQTELRKYYENRSNWNSMANLHLLSASQNRSKQDKSLSDWMAGPDAGFKKDQLLLDPNDSLDFKDFMQFCDRRREALFQRLRSNVVMTEELTPAPEVLDEMDEPESTEA